MESSQNQFQIYLPGLLKILAESLYSSPKVALRELIQNAHDSCIRRSLEHPQLAPRPRIDLQIDSATNTLTIQDNGSGLTTDEIREYLSTIGRSYTRELAESVAVMQPERAQMLVGQFGLGFLSAFLIASEIRVQTQSAAPGSPALEWQSDGSIHYELHPAEAMGVGTRVQLSLKPSAYFLLDREILALTAREYTDFLSTPVYVAGSPDAVNATRPPWMQIDPQIAMQTYIAQNFLMAEPLWILPLHDYALDLGHDTFTVPMDGFLFVPKQSIVSVREYGDMRVYIKRMFIGLNERDLLPPWAKFVRGVIDTPHLEPTASRESLQHDESFRLVQRAIEDQLIAGLHQLAATQPLVWKAMVRGHSDLMMGWAAAHTSFFEQIRQVIEFRTTRGFMSLPDYLRLTGEALYYTTQPIEALHQKVLAESAGMPVIDASWFAVEPFLIAYQKTNPGLNLIKLDHELMRLMQPAEEDGFQSLIAFYHHLNIPTQVAHFRPASIPAIMVVSKDATFFRNARSVVDHSELPGPFNDLLADFLEQHDEQAIQGTLYLNADCAFVQQIATAEASPNRDAILTLIHQMTRLFSDNTLESKEAIGLFDTSIQAFAKLL